jgi:hypothetical protein
MLMQRENRGGFMKKLSQSGSSRALIIAVAAFISLALLSYAQAVVPAPDGGYPGGNTAEGQSALLSLTSGISNTAVGWFSLKTLTSGKSCTGVGAAALLANTADNNTATGARALFNNTTGGNNTATGASALITNTTGGSNTAVGSSALYHNTTGGLNTATGTTALFHNTTGQSNTATGDNALYLNTSGNNNTAMGQGALVFNDGNDNTGVGAAALSQNGNGSNNTAVGAAALGGGDRGNKSVAFGTRALGHATGDNNTALGYHAGFNQTDGSNNVYIGQGIERIAGESDTCRIKSIFGQTAASGSAVFITSGNKLGTATSSKRFKEDIKPMDKASEALFSLKPVKFRYRKEVDPEGNGNSQYGLVAEDVEKVNPDLVVRDKEGKPYSVRYDQVNAMLLNEFLKAHREMEKLQKDFQTTVAQQQKEIHALTAQLTEQATEIQRVKDSSPQRVRPVADLN